MTSKIFPNQIRRLIECTDFMPIEWKLSWKFDINWITQSSGLENSNESLLFKCFETWEMEIEIFFKLNAFQLHVKVLNQNFFKLIGSSWS